MDTKSGHISDVILGALFSLALFGLINRGIDYSAEKCPYDTDNTKIIIYIVIAIVTFYILYRKGRE